MKKAPSDEEAGKKNFFVLAHDGTEPPLSKREAMLSSGKQYR